MLARQFWIGAAWCASVPNDFGEASGRCLARNSGLANGAGNGCGRMRFFPVERAKQPPIFLRGE